MISLFAFAAAEAMMASANGSSSCPYDKAAMLALDENKFDQDMTGGWRKVANEGCDIGAADLVRDWRTAHHSQASILYWHEGQLRANAGQTSAAIKLFERSRKPVAEDAPFGWNLYVAGTVAFLRRDRAGLEAARKRLAVLPRPADFDPVGPDGKPMRIAWPLNLNVLDGFLRCWAKPYKQAYDCATPMFRVTASDSSK